MGGGALFLAALDFSINVNLPRFRTDLGETLVSVQLIIVLYHGARSGTGFIAGGVADRFGIKWPLIAGIVLYTLAVGLISMQDSLAPIVALRIPQGVGVAILFTLGIFGIFLNRKNVIIILMSVELMLLAVNINLVAFSAYLGDLVGQVFAMFVLTVAAAEAAIGLAILVTYFRNRGTVAVEEINRMKG